MVVWISHSERVWLGQFQVRRLFIQRADRIARDVSIWVVDVFQCSVRVIWGTGRERRGGGGVGSLTVQRVFKLSLR